MTDDLNSLFANEPNLKPDHEKVKLVVEASKKQVNKVGLVQFRVDDQTMDKLKSLADNYGTSAGMLCRRWALEKINESENRHLMTAVHWHKERIESLRKEISGEQLYLNHPYFIVHVVPLSENRTIAPERAQAIAGSLRPLAYSRAKIIGRFNHLGYESSPETDSPAKIHLQVFRTGEVEAVRPMWLKSLADRDGISTMDAGAVDGEIVDAASTACATLAGLQIPLPYMIFTTICNAKNSTLLRGYNPIQSDCFDLPEIEVTAWEQIAAGGSADAMAFTMKPALDVLWNASGIASSGSFTGNNWSPNGPHR